MANEPNSLSGYGAPTKNTVGSIGDIYIDLSTGIKYKCKSIFSYTGHNSLTVEYIWKKDFSVEPGEPTEGVHCSEKYVAPIPEPEVEPTEVVTE